MKLGMDLTFFPEECRQPVDELFIETQPAHLQKGTAQKQKLAAGGEVEGLSRTDSVRAKRRQATARSKLKSVAQPANLAP
jgi:protein arginine kinase